MTGYKIPAETPFYREVKAKLKEFAATRGVVGQGELAHAMGRKVTVSLRRAMAQAEIDGLVTPFRFYSERGGLCKGFEIHIDLVQMPLQEADGMPF